MISSFACLALSFSKEPPPFGLSFLQFSYSEIWFLIPLEERWSPPQAVIDAFEKNGFVWGGKWSHFDNIHFEYAPEIISIAQSKLIELK